MLLYKKLLLMTFGTTLVQAVHYAEILSNSPTTTEIFIVCLDELFHFALIKYVPRVLVLSAIVSQLFPSHYQLNICASAVIIIRRQNSSGINRITAGTKLHSHMLHVRIT